MENELLRSRRSETISMEDSKSTSQGPSISAVEDTAAQEGDIVIDVPLTGSARMRHAMDIELEMPITPYDTSVLLEQGASANDSSSPQDTHQSGRAYVPEGSPFLTAIPSRSQFGNIPPVLSTDLYTSWSPVHSSPGFDLERQRIEADLTDALPEVVPFLDPWGSDEPPPQDFELALPEPRWSNQARLSVDAWHSPGSTAPTSPIRNITQARASHPTSTATYSTDAYGVFGYTSEEEHMDPNLPYSSRWGFHYITSSPAGSVRSSPRRSATNISNVFVPPSITPQQTVSYPSPSMHYAAPLGWTYTDSPRPSISQKILPYTTLPTAQQKGVISDASSQPPAWQGSRSNFALPSDGVRRRVSHAPTGHSNVKEEGFTVSQDSSSKQRTRESSHFNIGKEDYINPLAKKRVTNIADVFPPPTVDVEGQNCQPISITPGFDLSVAKGSRTSSILTTAQSTPSKSSWELYNDKARHEDKDFIRSVNESMDPLLVFAGLFSAVLTGFLQFTLPLLQPDQQQTTAILLSNLLTKLNNSTHPMLVQEEEFTPSAYAIRVNCLLFASIASALVASLGAILIKQWTRQYEIGLDTISSQQLRARTRHFRMDGVTKWHLMDIAAAIPITVHLSLFCFFIGMVDFLYPICRQVALVVLVFLVLAGVLYITTSTIPVAFSQAPFRSPLTSFIEHFISWFRSYMPDIRRSKQRGVYKAKSNLSSEEDNKSHNHPDQPDPKFDIDVLASLIKAADYRTEPWILDQCIDNLRDLQSQPTVRKRIFKRREILEAYRQLAASCVRRRVIDGTDVLDPNQEGRARALCEFAVWIAQDESTQAELNWLAQYLPQTGDELPRLLLRHGLKVSGNADTVIAAHLALSARNHIHTTSCWDCFQRQSHIYDYLLGLGEQMSLMDDTRLRSTRMMAIRFINNQTRCLLHFAAGYPTEAYIKEICKLVQRLQLYSAATIDAWDPIHLDRDYPLPPRRATRDDKWAARRDHWLESLRKALGVVSSQISEGQKEDPNTKVSWRNRQTTI